MSGPTFVGSSSAFCASTDIHRTSRSGPPGQCWNRRKCYQRSGRNDTSTCSLPGVADGEPPDLPAPVAVRSVRREFRGAPASGPATIPVHIRAAEPGRREAGVTRSAMLPDRTGRYPWPGRQRSFAGRSLRARLPGGDLPDRRTMPDAGHQASAVRPDQERPPVLVTTPTAQAPAVLHARSALAPLHRVCHLADAHAAPSRVRIPATDWKPESRPR